MWMWLIAVASGSSPLDLDAVESFVAFHCSNHNVPRLATPLPMLPVPDGIPHRVRQARVRRILIIGADGSLEGPSREMPQHTDAVWVHPDLDSARVREILARIAAGRTGAVPVLFAGTHAQPRPPEPTPGVDVELQVLRTQLASDESRRPNRRCATPPKEQRRCSTHAVDVIRRLQSERCAEEAHRVLAHFALRYDRGAPGYPVALVDVPVEGPTPLRDVGTWSSEHATFLGHPTAGLRQASEGVPGPPFGLWKEVAEPEVLRRVLPLAQARVQFQTCRARVYIDERGAPVNVTVSGCAADFVAATTAALTQWRWYPVKEDGEPIKAQTVINVYYR